MIISRPSALFAIATLSLALVACGDDDGSTETSSSSSSSSTSGSGGSGGMTSSSGGGGTGGAGGMVAATGTVSGTISYQGNETGTLYVAAFDVCPPQGPPSGLATILMPTYPQAFTIEDLDEGE